MFTQVNFRCVNKVGRSVNDRASNDIAFVRHKALPIVDPVNALKRKTLV
jgi:hypothetical protein